MVIKSIRYLLSAFVVVVGSASAKAGPVLEFTTPGIPYSFGQTVTASVGWSFTTNSSITVTALDAILLGETSANVRLYDASGTTIASATVTTADPSEGNPTSFYSATLATPVVLAANTTYLIAEDENAGAYWYGYATPLTTDPSISYAGGISTIGKGKNPLSDIEVGQVNPAYFGPNFDISPSVVPEPPSIILQAAGLFILIACSRRGFTRRIRHPLEV